MTEEKVTFLYPKVGAGIVIASDDKTLLAKRKGSRSANGTQISRDRGKLF